MPTDASPAPRSPIPLWLLVIAGALLFGAGVAAAYLLAERPGYVPVGAIAFAEPDPPPPPVVFADPAASFFPPDPPLPVLALEPHLTGVHRLKAEGDAWRITDRDPQLVYRLAELQLAGADAPYLGFDFECLERQGEPAFRIFHWGDAVEGPTEDTTATFSAPRNGTYFVPLGASASYAALGIIRGIRIDLQPWDRCGAMRIGNVALYAAP